MKYDWTPIDKMKPPAKADCKILMYSPSGKNTIIYRVVDVSQWEKLKDATHWQPLLPPTL